MDNVTKILDIAEYNDISSVELIDLFLNYHGNQLVTNEFLEFIEEEGYYIP